MNPSAALGMVLADELVRCGLREAVLSPGSRSAPLALALLRRAEAGGLRLHVRADERSAAFLALGLAKASRRPAAVVCTSGTAAAHLHAAVIEADEACVPLLVLTADRPPELRGTGANQTIDQLKLYGGAVRWFWEAGPAEARTGMNGYWRSAACRAWALASGDAGGPPGPVHVNVPLREPLVPEAAELAAGWPEPAARRWPEPLEGRADGAPWTRVRTARSAGDAAIAGLSELVSVERGVVVCGDGDYDAGPLLALAERAGWPVLAEPSSNARRGPNALRGYGYLLEDPAFAAAHRPEVIVSAGRPGLSRGQLALLRGAPPGEPAPAIRHIVVAQAPGRWADPARTATDVLPRFPAPPGRPAPGRSRGRGAWLAEWQRADTAACAAVDAILDEAGTVSEPRLARDLAAALPDGALLWAASSLPVRDLDRQLAPSRRPPGPGSPRILASRGASGIDGLTSAAFGAALAHQAAGGGPAFALLGDLALLHDAAGLFVGPQEPRPDLCLIVVNNDGGGIFSTLEQARLPGPVFERVFGTPHGADLRLLAAAAGLPYTLLERPGELPGAVTGHGLRIVEVRVSRAEGAALRDRLRRAAASAVSALAPAP
jgi:2-succinyl-5-enolpyruvyl-6-hydroxy-3-cyclohexene-1-carboxylate synthase